jgi:HAE1 family hydrophobic/amphiphilic exporter-1
MGVDEVIAGLQSENVNTPLGRLNRDSSEYPLRISGKPDVVDRFRTMVIGQRDGRPVMLSEVSEVMDGIEEQRSLAFVNGVQAVSLDILKQSGANVVGVVDLVKKEGISDVLVVVGGVIPAKDVPVLAGSRRERGVSRRLAV